MTINCVDVNQTVCVQQNGYIWVLLHSHRWIKQSGRLFLRSAGVVAPTQFLQKPWILNRQRSAVTIDASFPGRLLHGSETAPAAPCANLCAGCSAGSGCCTEQCNWAACITGKRTTVKGIIRISSFMLDMTSPAKLCSSTLGAHDRRWGLNFFLWLERIKFWLVPEKIYMVFVGPKSHVQVHVSSGYLCMVHVAGV